METIDEGTFSYVGSSIQTIKPLFDIQSFPLHILPIFIIDTLLTLVIFLFCGYDGILDFIIRSAQGSFSESLFDLAVLCVIRNFYLILITWRLRNINGIHIILRVIMFILIVFSITYTVTKIILTFDVMDHLPGIISLNYTFLALCLVMSIVEFPIAVLVLRKNKQLITEFGYLSLTQEEEEDDCVIKREIIKEGAKHSSFRRVLKMAKQEVPILLGGMVGLLISSLTMLLLPGYFGAIITAVSTPMEEHLVKQEILNAVIALLVIFVVGGFFTFIRGWLFTLAGHRVVRRLRKQLFNIISVKDIAYFDKNRTGELTNRLTSDTQLLQDTVTVNISMVIRNLVQVVGGIAFMFVISWKLSLVMLGAVPVVTIAAVLYGGYVRNLTVKFQEMLAHSTSTAEEAISNIRTVKSFSHEKKSQQEYEKDINKSLDIGKSLSLASGLFIGLVSIFSQGAIIVVVWFGGSLVLSKEMNAGTLMAFLIYTLTTAVGFAAMSGMFGEVMKAIGAAERIFQLVDDVPQIPISGGKRLNLVKGFIKLTDISFAYPSKQDTPTLKNINLDLSSGEVVALVGPSGGGKSTIVSLIERFYDPDSGTVTLDGCNIKELDPEWYHLQIGYVSQEPVLFGCSIRDNIILGNENITQEQVELAAKKANAEEFISKLEKGYDTMVGERGVLLSGGQKQRVAIARALVLNPKILLFDEATSALDAESEHLVQEAIDKAMEDRTVLIIAHRLSTVRNASKVVVVVNGMIKEEGTHDQLMEKGGIYKKLVKRQLAK